jgi:hypothetical protein
MQSAKLQAVATLLNKSQNSIKFSVKGDKMLYTLGNVTYASSLDDIIEMFDKAERVKL